jgi:SAM-dependent methyltransferase
VRSGAAGSRPRHAQPQSWDELAEWWRTTFTNGADVEYDRQILPLAATHLAGCRRILDLGCGEGQLARRLAEGGGSAGPGASGDAAAEGGDGSFGGLHVPELVVGLDPYRRQLENALRLDGGVVLVQGAGECLPFPAATFDAVVCCLVIEHAADPDKLLTEVARVVAPGGRFLLLVNHPVIQGPGSGFVDDRLLEERYWRIGPYLPETVSIEEVDPGVRVAFAHRPLSRYVNPLTDRGLVLTRLEEPAPPLEFLDGSIDIELELAMPRLCLMRFERR